MFETIISIRCMSNGVVLNDDEVFEFRDSGNDKRARLEILLNRILEEIGENSFKAEVTG